MEKKKNFIINFVYFLMIGGIILGICKYILPVMIPFILAFFAAALIQIPVRKLGKEKIRWKKALSVLFCCIFYVLLFLAVAVVGVKMLGGAGKLVEAAPIIYQDKIVPFLENISDRMEMSANSAGIELAEQIENSFQEFTQNIGQYVSEFSMKAVKIISGGITEIPGFIVKVVVMVVSTFFMAADYDRIMAFFKEHIPQEKEVALCGGVNYVKNTIGIYVKSYSFLFLLTFAELSIGFMILKVPYPILLGLAIAVFDILPVLGTGGILLPWAVILFFMKNTPLAVGILVLYLIITVIRNIVEPKLVGKQIGLHPLATLMAMFLGLKLTGIVGMIIFPVALAVAMGVVKNKKT
ncbi:MAG: sporulation integral membrane protein YtvI [Eubacterium sp.]|nr:sporulation integral membrane protein YtvI [Eubacterium sp.]MBP3487821.1 sporulation integral membrane protein YtvI [Roseburia sp.]